MGLTILQAIRTAMALLLVGLLTIVLGVVAVIVAAVRPSSHFIDRRIIRFWARFFLWSAGFDLEVSGAENIDESRAYVFVSNHESDADIPCHFLACRVPIRFLAKKELYRVPLLGFYMRRLGFIEVDRQARAAGMESVNRQVADAVSYGRSLMIYPEGTRSRDGALQAFKKGAFRIAIDTGLDVIPLAVEGSWEAWPPGSKIIRGGTVKVTVGEPISVDGLTAADIEQLRNRAYEEVSGFLAQS